eukprot:EG_transcript_14137
MTPNYSPDIDPEPDLQPNNTVPTADPQMERTEPPTSASEPVVVNCVTTQAKNRRSRKDSPKRAKRPRKRAGPPERASWDVHQKLKILAYADAHGVRAAARFYKMKSHGCILDWQKNRSALAKVLLIGRNRRSLHRGRASGRKDLEINLRRWIMCRRSRGLSVTKGMVISKAKCWNERGGEFQTPGGCCHRHPRAGACSGLVATSVAVKRSNACQGQPRPNTLPAPMLVRRLCILQCSFAPLLLFLP